MPSDCPACDTQLVTVAVPEDLREFAPDSTATAGICPECLTVTATDSDSTAASDSAAGGDSTAASDGTADSDPDFGRIVDTFPDGEAGVALALLIGKLPSLAVEKDAVSALRDRAEAAGADVVLTLDRLVGATKVDPHFSLERKVVQMEQLV
jgi:hypothetical protein